MLKAEDLNPERRGSHAAAKKTEKTEKQFFFVLSLQAFQQPFSIFGIEDA
jgi:hypothetical protein